MPRNVSPQHSLTKCFPPRGAQILLHHNSKFVHPRFIRDMYKRSEAIGLQHLAISLCMSADRERSGWWTHIKKWVSIFKKPKKSVMLPPRRGHSLFSESLGLATAWNSGIHCTPCQGSACHRWKKQRQLAELCSEFQKNLQLREAWGLGFVRVTQHGRILGMYHDKESPLYKSRFLGCSYCQAMSRINHVPHSCNFSEKGRWWLRLKAKVPLVI